MESQDAIDAPRKSAAGPKLTGYRPLKAVSMMSGQLPKYRHDNQQRKQTRHTISVDGTLNGKLLSTLHGINLIQAARDGLLDIVKAHLEAGHASVNEVDEEGYTALHYAARYNQVEVMKALVDAGADVNIKQGQDDVRPLHLASRYNNDSATYFLLEKRAIINIKDVKGRTPLHYATRKGHEKVIKMLISVSSCNVNEPDSDMTTPLIMAALQGNSIICETLISRGADIERKDINEMTALMWAAAEGHTAVCKVLLKAATRHGINNERRYIRACDKEGNTALHFAVQNGSLEVVNLLLSHGADVNCVKKNLATPLSVAAVYGFMDIAKVLVYNGADINSSDVEQMTAIHKAALYNKVDILEFLVKRGGNLNAKDKNKMSPLHCACWKGQTEAVAFLLSNGAQIAESDIGLNSALHWAVKFDHFETLLVLIQHGGKHLVACTDKKDQTALHIAATTGNVAILKTLLDIGSRPDVKDQNERSALHIAAQYDNVSCVEALIQASNHETNDDDIDGRTPLLLACLSGHQRAVQVLLSLGSDVSRRDDEHCTALMLAAAEGHTTVMRILLENHAGVNDVDKTKNTALHYACLGGHVEAVQLLLDKKADVTVKNTYEHSPIDLAIDNLHYDVANAILRTKKTCQACLSVRGPSGQTVLDRLIAKMPESALIVLDHCVERTTRDDDDRNLTMKFDYQYIDPGPDDPGCQINRYFALNTMVKHERDVLLSHPLCQNLLSQKWVIFGRQLFYLNLLSYLGYLSCLTMFAFNDMPDLLHEVSGCAVYLNETLEKIKVRFGRQLFYLNLLSYLGYLSCLAMFAFYDMPDLLHEKSGCAIYLDAAMDKFKISKDALEAIRSATPPTTKWRSETHHEIYVYLLYFFVALSLLRDFTKIVSQKLKYFFNIYNIIVWILSISTLIFILPEFTHESCLTHYRAGWIALFLACINCIMYLRRIDLLGIYVIMFVTVLSSLLKVVLVFLMFCFAFAGCFYLIMQHIQVFADLRTLMLNVIVMTLGEIEYVDLFMSSNLEPFSTDIKIQLLIFLFLMPIVLMNLMIGVAVGDIETIQHNAYLKRIALQVDLMYNIENNMPKFMQRRVHVKRATVKPNEGTTHFWQNISSFLFGSSRKVQFIEAGSKDKVTIRLEHLNEKLATQQQSLKILLNTVQAQASLLHQIASKLDINTSGLTGVGLPSVHVDSGGGTVTQPSTVFSGTGVSFDNTAISIERSSRSRSVRIRDTSDDRPERPRSTVI